MSGTLKERTTIGILWSLIEKVGQQSLFFISGVILSWILTPEIFGEIGVLAVFIAVSDALVDSGFNRGLLNKKDVDQDHYNTVFYFNLGISIFLYILLFLLAPLIAAFFDSPSLVVLSRVLFLKIPLNALSSIQNVILWKNINMRVQARASILAMIISSLVAVIMALAGFKVWALVMQQVLLSFGRSLFLWYWGNWKPTLTFRKDILTELFPFGSKLMLSGVLNSVFNNIYSVIIGRFFNLHQVGIYTQANKYQDMAINIPISSFRSVSIPVFAEMKDDNERLQRVMSKMVKTVTFVFAPLAGFLFVTAYSIFVGILGPQWEPSVPVFQILCIGGYFAGFNFIFGESMVAKGRSDIFLGLESGKKLMLLIFIPLLFQFGLIGLAYSWVLYSFCGLMIAIYISGRVIGYSFLNYFKDSLPYLLIAVIASLTAYYLSTYLTNNYVKIVLNGIVIGVLYLSFTGLFRLEALNEVRQWLTKYRNK